MKRYILILASVALMFGCNEKDAPLVSNDSITASADTLSFGPEGGTQELRITSSGDWRISGLSDWVKPSATEGRNGATISFTAEENSGSETKESVFKIFTGSAVKQIALKMDPAYMVSLESDAEVNIASDGEAVNVKLDTNIPDFDLEYSGDGADWISFDSRMDAFGMTMLKFNVDKSRIFKNRNSVVKIKGEGKEISVKFIQAQRDTIIVDGSRIVYDLAARDMEIKLKSNVEPDYSLASWMEKTGETAEPAGEDGLAERTIKIHLNEASSSRIYTLSFSNNNVVYSKYTVKQQNPNPILCNISDATLRVKLTELGWIIGDETSTECEVLEPGLTGTSLSLSGSGYYYRFGAEKIDGLGAFPMLETLSVTNAEVSSIDVSDSKSLKTVKLQQDYKIREIKTGSSPVTEVNFGTYRYDYISSSSVSVSGDNIRTIYANNSSYYISYGYDGIEELDVTGCPSLVSLKAKREYSNYWSGTTVSLKTIYVTAAQKTAIDAGTLAVEKSDQASIVVK